jgi:hypothetical protein
VAYIKAAAVRTRIREVIEASAGTLRTVPTDRFLGDLPEGLDVTEEMRRALEAPRVSVSIRRASPHPQTPLSLGNIALDNYEFVVRVVRTISTLEQLIESDSDALDALAMIDSDVLRQALGFPGNLSSTTAGTSTDIVSGMLRWTSSDWRVERAINDGAQKLETVHQFAGVLISRPAV